jgi:hypothetical protein
MPFFISFSMASRQKRVPVRSSNSNACLTDFGNEIPCFWVRLWYRVLHFLIIQSRLRKASLTQCLTSGFLSRLLAMAYSASSIGLSAFKLFTVTQVVVPSTNRTSNSATLVAGLIPSMVGGVPSSTFWCMTCGRQYHKIWHTSFLRSPLGSMSSLQQHLQIHSP